MKVKSSLKKKVKGDQIVKRGKTLRLINKHMYCENCGTKIEEKAEFCQNCGRKVGVSSAAHNPPKNETPVTIQAGDIFYSEEWRRKKVFALASMPYFDVVADNQYLSLIRLPSYSGQTWGLILGLILLNILGAIIGSVWGSSIDTKKRKWYRSAWIDENKNVISREYEHDVYIRIPLGKVTTAVTFKPNKFDVDYEGKKLTLQKSKLEVEKLTKFINEHVL